MQQNKNNYGASVDFKELTNQFSGKSLESGNSQYVRHNAYSEAGQEALRLYDKGVKIMKERSAANQGDPLGWSYQAGIHGTFLGNPPSNINDLASWAEANNYVSDASEVLEGNTVLNNCTHWLPIWSGQEVIPASEDMSVNFILWHRLYLQSFEDVIREVLTQSGETGASTWALPYWQYTDPNEDVIPELFRDSTSALYEASRSVLINKGLGVGDLVIGERNENARWNALTLIQDGQARALQSTTYHSANSGIESSPHNIMHMLLGGNYDILDENKNLVSAEEKNLIEGNWILSKQQETAEALGVDPSFIPTQGNGLMENVGAAALDPVFWTHHAFIDWLFSKWNASSNASYAFSYELANNPWNYQFFAPSINGSETPETYSYWGNNSDKVLRNIYNPNYTYDNLGDDTSLGQSNPALALLDGPSYRPVITRKDLEGAGLTSIQSTNEFGTAIEFNTPLTLKDIYNAISSDIMLQVDIDYKLKMSSDIPFTVYFGSYSQLASAIQEGTLNNKSGLPYYDVPPLSMGVSDMPMAGEAVVDLSALLDLEQYPQAQIEQFLAEYGSEPLGMAVISKVNDITLSNVELTLNQHIKAIDSSGSDFDGTTYLAQNPSLLADSEAIKDPEAHYNAQRTRNDIAPKLNFRAASAGLQYLMSNTELVRAGISSSPYTALAQFLNEGMAEGRSLGGNEAMLQTSWIPENSVETPVLDFTSLTAGQTITADVLIGRDAVKKPIVGFYSVLDRTGTVRAQNGTLLSPEDEGYAAAALNLENLFDPLTGLNTDSNQAVLKTVTFDSESGYLAPYAFVDGNYYFGFAAANADGISHFVHLGKNIIGLEDIFGGGDLDYDDTLVGFNFANLQ